MIRSSQFHWTAPRDPAAMAARLRRPPHHNPIDRERLAFEIGAWPERRCLDERRIRAAVAVIDNA